MQFFTTGMMSSCFSVERHTEYIHFHSICCGSEQLTSSHCKLMCNHHCVVFFTLPTEHFIHMLVNTVINVNNIFELIMRLRNRNFLCYMFWYVVHFVFPQSTTVLLMYIVQGGVLSLFCA
jgi:hypothetical protein